MLSTLQPTCDSRLALCVQVAQDLMTANPISIPATATVKEAVAVLVEKRISAAAVVDVLGQPIGVLSQTDILIHDRNKAKLSPPVPEYYQTIDLTCGSKILLTKFNFVSADRTLVHHVMTPTVISVGAEDSVLRVVGQMVAFKVHRLLVTDKDGILVGVISAFDVLRKLRVEKLAGT
jgi:CBS domain-containing protein